jgi:uncharacterized protein (TIGR03083 family)
MPATLPPIDWVRAQEAVRSASARVGVLLRNVSHPDAPAVGEWNVTDVAAHMSHGIDTIGAMARGGGGLLPELSGLATMTKTLVHGEAERDLGHLADRIEASTADLLALMRNADSDASRPWIVQGTEFRLSNLTCHALNELIVHGWDIAMADGTRWPIPRSDAALVVSGFLFPALANLGRSMVNERTASDVRVSYDIHVRGGGRAVFRFDKGDLSIDPPGTGPVDCHLSVDPTAFLLVAWDRISQWRAIPRGQLLAWGRRPWLGLKLRSYVRTI